MFYHSTELTCGNFGLNSIFKWMKNIYDQSVWNQLSTTHNLFNTDFYPLIHLTAIQNPQSKTYLCHSISACLQLKSNIILFLIIYRWEYEIHGQHVHPYAYDTTYFGHWHCQNLFIADPVWSQKVLTISYNIEGATDEAIGTIFTLWNPGVMEM
jgi:hypothetical protein